ncbi:TonB-dependent receptor [Sphingomonas sp. RG327]|uniref:TonB-dependent receptor n=1 Tax=Sphingomonas anseongensis TaxID=2908207 RepID=A0ABT0RE12_9SPHN|nr:TonB-dependent receptor [Sphingomonas anseongensis]MCL6678474.1 TonB-dependent receptor [Sphingomonas anseongensis]
MFRSSRLLLCGVSATAVAFATPAFAQDAPTAPTTLPGQTPPNCPVNGPGSAQDNCVSGEVETESGTTANAGGNGAIVVTGTRIQRPNLQSPVPITSVGQEELTNQGQASVGDALNDLPALRSTFSQQNSGRFIGTAGQNFLDLRGLGTTRTLVLVNGRRHITSSPGDFIVDVDNIPQDLLERVDIVTGGESAVYGSDAIAGVVNFVTKRNFDGFRIRGQAGISSRGDRPVDFISATMGRNFFDDRANVALNLEYTHAGELFFRDRPRAAEVCGFQPNPADNGGADDPTTAGGDNTNGVPDNVFVCGIRNPFVTNGGSIGFLGGGQVLAFDPAGNLIISNPPQQDFTDFTGGTIVSNDPNGGSTLRETGDLAVGRNRYMANLLAHFDVSDAFKPFIEASYIKQTVYQEGQPSFFQARLSQFFGIQSFRCNNPFLTAQNLAVLQSFGLCANPAVNTIPLNRFNVDWGGRVEEDHRTTYRIVGGAQGNFLGDWHYEVSANYGHFKSNNIEKNDLLLFDENGNLAGFGLASNAVRDVNGNIVCGVNADADPTNDAPGCVPINPFGFGRASPEAIAYSNTTSHLFSKASELDLLAFMSGNSGRWFELPGGPIGFSIGAEYRKETAHSIADPVSASGGTFFNAFPEFDPPSFSVKEIFGELEVPILKDRPFFHELTVSGAARYSDYNTAANHTFAWNLNGIWSPVRDLRLRGNLSRSVRVPTLSDLFTPPTQNFAQLNDPCDQARINLDPDRAANCAALGVPTTVTSTNSPCFAQNPTANTGPVGSPFHNCLANTQTTLITSAGNPDLKEETGKSITLGAVITPRFIPGFSFSADYFDIKVTNLISVLGGNAILNNCFNASSINNQYCSLLGQRDQFGLFIEPALTSAGVNFAKQTSRGVDFDLTYRKRFANGHRLDLRGIATYTLNRTNFTDPTFPKVGDRQLSELGDPVFSGTMIAGYGIGPFDLRYTFRYIGSMTDWDYEDTHSFGPACDPIDPTQCPPFNSDVADRINTGSVTYSDIRLNFTIKNRYQMYLGVDNLFDRQPPLRLTGAGAGSGIYSGIGRFFYAGFIVDLK